MLQVLIRIAGIPFLLWIVAKVCIQLIPLILFTLGLLILAYILALLGDLVLLLTPRKVLDGISAQLNKQIIYRADYRGLRWGTLVYSPPFLLVPFCVFEYYLFISEISQWVVGFLSVGILR
jgi:membrane protease YdiL (CAAX protease family)